MYKCTIRGTSVHVYCHPSSWWLTLWHFLPAVGARFPNLSPRMQQRLGPPPLPTATFHDPGNHYDRQQFPSNRQSDENWADRMAALKRGGCPSQPPPLRVQAQQPRGSGQQPRGWSSGGRGTGERVVTEGRHGSLTMEVPRQNFVNPKGLHAYMYCTCSNVVLSKGSCQACLTRSCPVTPHGCHGAPIC